MKDGSSPDVRAAIVRRATACLVACLSALPAACVETPSRPGPAEPVGDPPDVVLIGDYAAVELFADRGGTIADLLADGDTRLDVRLNADGTAFGQLKIAGDSDLRTKQAVVGTWRFAPPAQVTFDLEPSNFLEEIVFRADPPRLTGEWLSPGGVRLHIELERPD